MRKTNASDFGACVVWPLASETEIGSANDLDVSYYDHGRGILNENRAGAVCRQVGNGNATFPFASLHLCAFHVDRDCDYGYDSALAHVSGLHQVHYAHHAHVVHSQVDSVSVSVLERHHDDGGHGRLYRFLSPCLRLFRASQTWPKK